MFDFAQQEGKGEGKGMGHTSVVSYARLRRSAPGRAGGRRNSPSRRRPPLGNGGPRPGERRWKGRGERENTESVAVWVFCSLFPRRTGPKLFF